jgi:AcrR family transcriptional regulator
MLHGSVSEVVDQQATSHEQNIVRCRTCAESATRDSRYFPVNQTRHLMPIRDVPAGNHIRHTTRATAKPILIRHTVRVTEAKKSRATSTRTTLLDAARQIFTAAGYTDANVVDIVERAGSSVGSLYHHFGGKSDLYIALYDDYQSRQRHRAAKAFRVALASGEQDAMRLFIVSTRAYLEGCWEERELAQLFLSGGGPPGFELLTRRGFRHWLNANSELLSEQARPLPETLVLVLTTIATEAGREVAVQPSRAAARRFIQEILDLIGRLYPTD